MKNRSRKRTLAFERLETKAAPASLLIALAPLDEDSHQQLEKAASDNSLSAIDSTGNWQFSHAVGTLLQFVDEHTLSPSSDSTSFTPPTWEQCQSAEEMMKLHDRDLLALVMAERFGSDEPIGRNR